MNQYPCEKCLSVKTCELRLTNSCSILLTYFKELPFWLIKESDSICGYCGGNLYILNDCYKQNKLVACSICPRIWIVQYIFKLILFRKR